MEGYLHLENGETYKGEWLSHSLQHEVKGEIVFFTGMTGYQEVISDPSYKDQIIVFTYPLIGNYGINESHFESKKPHAAGVIIYEGSEMPSHYKSKYTFKQYLEKWNVPVLGHMDTRAIVKKIRAHGTMAAVMTQNSDPDNKKYTMVKDQKVSKVASSVIEQFGDGEQHIVVIDYGAKKSIVDCLLKRNCQVTIVPYSASIHDIHNLNPDGIVLSNGPGDPKELVHKLPVIKEMVQSYPTLGICLGHQLVALALGADTKKLAFGHRGANHPVADLERGRVFMSSQNHSYVVDEVSLHGTGLKKRFINLHDQSVEGLVHDDLLIQTVQFHPEAHPGPSDAEYVFDEFLKMTTLKKRSYINA
ncbi:carbamoyl phosphate synthase small subunit [Cytobacillus gottheilii]|uniref:carbamoyl phosphate synthase small subunit n=1 Tax=Cytobacillus gottheilii TaxID=859144 RepID=UPI0009B9586C|nr:carbamoyl phosphate synthase small subunit [Cytobacillus gottheilii]